MAIYGEQLTHNWSASVSFGSKQYYFAQLNTSNGDSVIVGTGGCNPYPIGVVQNSPCAGEEAEVCIFGISKVYYCCATAVNVGDFIRSSSVGQGEYAANACAANAIALQAAGAGASATITAFILPPGTRAVADQAY